MVLNQQAVIHFSMEIGMGNMYLSESSQQLKGTEFISGRLSYIIIRDN